MRTKDVDLLIKKWKPGQFDVSKFGAPHNPVVLECRGLTARPAYIGAIQRMLIEAPIASVEQVLDRFEEYVELFPGFKRIEVVNKTGTEFLTRWEQRIPIPFVSNEVYDIVYRVEKAERKAVYRYFLKAQTNLKYSDGAIVLESLGPNRTGFVEIDFFEADWGFAKNLVPLSRMWKEGIEGLYLSDLGVKFRAEHSDWSFRKIRETAKQSLREFPVEPCIEKRRYD